MKSLVIIAHMPSENTRRLAEAVRDGAQSDEIAGVTSRLISPFEADAADVLNADAVILGTTENLGYMSGAYVAFRSFRDASRKSGVELVYGNLVHD